MGVVNLLLIIWTTPSRSLPPGERRGETGNIFRAGIGKPSENSLLTLRKHRDELSRFMGRSDLLHLLLNEIPVTLTPS